MRTAGEPLPAQAGVTSQPDEREAPAIPAELLRAADMDQLARLWRGWFVFPALPIVLATATRYKIDHPLCFWVFAAVIAVAMILRFVFMVGRDRIYNAGPRYFNGLLVISIILSSGGCGLLYFSTLWFYGFESWTFTTVLLWILGIASGSTIAFTPKFWLLQIHLMILLGPVWVLGAWMGGQDGYSFTLALLAYIAFLVLQGRIQHRAYWKQIQDTALEKARTLEVEAARRAAEAASVAKGKFLANMSHEIRTPMHGILGMAELAISAETPQESQDYVRTLRGSAQGLLHVLNDILDFSKIEAGKLAIEQTAFSLRQIIEETRKIIVPQARTKKLKLLFRTDSDVPDLLIGDPARLRQVLVNLVGNAAKFTDAGSVELSVMLAEQPHPDQPIRLRFRVADTGIGISPDQQKLIFEAFAQADAGVSRKFGGTGLGLAICSQLVQLMGGQIAVESRLGAGSVFEFTCIVGVAAGQEIAAPVPLTVEALDAMNILLAEDNPVNQTIAARMLTKEGHRVTIVDTGLAAVQAWQSKEFDLILMDDQMPEMSGIEAVQQIRSMEAACGRQHTAIIALTASAMAGDRQRFLAIGMDGYLAKPFNAYELNDAMRELKGHCATQPTAAGVPSSASPA